MRIIAALLAWLAPAAMLALSEPACAQSPGAPSLGPYTVGFLQGGVGLSRALPASPLLAADAPWSVSFWIRPDFADQTATLMRLESPGAATGRALLLDHGRVTLQIGSAVLGAQIALAPASWTLVCASFEKGRARLYIDGHEVGSGPVSLSPESAPRITLAPVEGEATNPRHFGGGLVALQLWDKPLTADAVLGLAQARPDFSLVALQIAGLGWPLQKSAIIGLTEPQDAWTLPRSRAPFQKPAAKPLTEQAPLVPAEDGGLALRRWRLCAASKVTVSGQVLSRADYSDAAWTPATVPGTVLTTLIDQGIYPDPDFGLNNMAIPESLAHGDYWYRTHFVLPPDRAGERLKLVFKGVNYAAEVWLNGRRLGDIRGAFVRGVFDVSALVEPGTVNVLAVRVSPPPHPGIASEESVAYGPGDNGGALALDGPTFVATEGWDWISGIRDRNTGLWQDVELQAASSVAIHDPYVVSHVAAADLDHARIDIFVPLQNPGAISKTVALKANFEGVEVDRTVVVPPGGTEVRLEAKDYPQLNLSHPRLWWPNGYGKPELYHLRVKVTDAAGKSEETALRFGVREVTYELSLFDHQGRLRRVEIDPAADRGVSLVDGRHEAIKKVANGWAQSLTPAGEVSSAVRQAPPSSLSPYLVIRVNGVPIAARGGSWGMDDSRKRVDRARLEPYFRLEREAHLNIIRNWLGQNTEDVFYDLADENGLLVLNDFWVSTQDFQIEPQDPDLFLKNAEDVISRYRSHPSIAVWFGRNEGVPQPILNEGLADLVNRLDGTRLYTGSSNRVNLQDSGPYAYRPPEAYFTDLAKGFAVEVGTPSLATLESLKAMLAPEDRWPLGDVIAYHDWHFGGNGDVASFMQALKTQFGEAASLEDFERKAQMMNLVDYRAIFEGFNAHLWTENSGRLLWMTHPSWPSNHWQIYSADYDTHAAYYGVKHAAEPVHVQMNLPDFRLAVVNTTREALRGLKLEARVVGLDGALLRREDLSVDAPSNQTTSLKTLALADLFEKAPVLLVDLRLVDAQGSVISRSLYWQARAAEALNALNGLKPQTLRLSGVVREEGGESVASLRLENPGAAPVLEAKLTLVDAAGQRILPAYYSDNYVCLLPGEVRSIEIRFPSARRAARVAVRGWNVTPDLIDLDSAPPFAPLNAPSSK